MTRLPFVDEDTLSPEQVSLLESSLSPKELPESQQHIFTTRKRNAHRLVGNNPDVLAALREYLGELWEHSGLSVRERELVILTVACETGYRYEWHQHVRHALVAGLTIDEIRSLVDGDTARFSEREVALVEYVRSFVHDTVDDDLLDSIVCQYESAGVVGISMIIVFYLGLRRIINVFDIETEEPFVGWKLERL